MRPVVGHGRFCGRDQIARFKLLLNPNGASDIIPRIFPVCLARFNTNAARNAGNVYLARTQSQGSSSVAIPNRPGGLVAPEGSQEYAGVGIDYISYRFSVLSEPEAGAVHCVLWKDLRLTPGQSFMVCNAGGGNIKLGFNGKQEARDLHFECFDPNVPALSDHEFLNGQLVLPVNDLRERVFDPVINKVLGVLEAQLHRVDSVNALVLVGRFSANPYLLDRIRRRLGATQYGLEESLIQRSIGAPTIIASKSYIMGIGPNLAISPGGYWNSGNPPGVTMSFNGIFDTYLVVKGALLKKGEPVLQEFMKTSSSLSDFVFITRVYTSDSAEIRADTSGGDLEYIQNWEIDLSAVSLFKQHARILLGIGLIQVGGLFFCVVFEIGIEIESQVAPFITRLEDFGVKLHLARTRAGPRRSGIWSIYQHM
ncbi:hypothetical protein BS47DRAFT_1361793 [Hydnum rufescens UP504]|uniref:Uncharacterized protein n=1 Tax=Hydnum rufescens UP504 TaxID=1448309 RepID=A0A9P6DTG7_9AGAM|nr:hypothetical protein BS47DRAFT_1361793 [Hydnum rufescens UP504]